MKGGLFTVSIIIFRIFMPSLEIQNLIYAVENDYGPVFLYDDAGEHDVCFIMIGIPATFSVHTQEGTLPVGQYDIQIESRPPGEYIYTSVVSLEAFLRLVLRLQGPEEQWPSANEIIY